MGPKQFRDLTLFIPVLDTDARPKLGKSGFYRRSLLVVAKPVQELTTRNLA